jgi:hypothetical protein
VHGWECQAAEVLRCHGCRADGMHEHLLQGSPLHLEADAVCVSACRYVHTAVSRGHAVMKDVVAVPYTTTYQVAVLYRASTAFRKEHGRCALAEMARRTPHSAVRTRLGSLEDRHMHTYLDQAWWQPCRLCAAMSHPAPPLAVEPCTRRTQSSLHVCCQGSPSGVQPC